MGVSGSQQVQLFDSSGLELLLFGCFGVHESGLGPNQERSNYSLHVKHKLTLTRLAQKRSREKEAAELRAERQKAQRGQKG